MGAFVIWSERRDLNPQQPAWEAGILPLNYFRMSLLILYEHICLFARDILSYDIKFLYYNFVFVFWLCYNAYVNLSI